MMRYRGQSMLEALGFFMVIGLLLGTLWQYFHGQALSAQQRLEHSRNLAWQVVAEAPTELSNQYTAARALEPVLAPLAQWTELDLPVGNLRVLAATDDHLAVARLHDDWAPNHRDDLQRRPAQLVPMHHLGRLGLNQVLEVFAWLPVTREFSARSLRLGWVNDEATPAELRCDAGNCQ